MPPPGPLGPLFLPLPRAATRMINRSARPAMMPVCRFMEPPVRVTVALETVATKVRVHLAGRNTSGSAHALIRRGAVDRRQRHEVNSIPRQLAQPPLEEPPLRLLPR